MKHYIVEIRDKDWINYIFRNGYSMKKAYGLEMGEVSEREVEYSDLIGHGGLVSWYFEDRCKKYPDDELSKKLDLKDFNFKFLNSVYVNHNYKYEDWVRDGITNEKSTSIISEIFGINALDKKDLGLSDDVIYIIREWIVNMYPYLLATFYKAFGVWGNKRLSAKLMGEVLKKGTGGFKDIPDEDVYFNLVEESIKKFNAEVKGILPMSKEQIASVVDITEGLINELNSLGYTGKFILREENDELQLVVTSELDDNYNAIVYNTPKVIFKSTTDGDVLLDVKGISDVYFNCLRRLLSRLPFPLKSLTSDIVINGCWSGCIYRSKEEKGSYDFIMESK